MKLLSSHDLDNNALTIPHLCMIKQCEVISHMLYTLVRQWCRYIYFETNIQIPKIVFEYFRNIFVCRIVQYSFEP